MAVAVISSTGKVLMPTSEYRARKLLKSGKAVKHSYRPFTIQLTQREEGKEQLALCIETIACTGIRISEIKYFTVERVKAGKIEIYNKGKYRRIFLPKILQKKLLSYCHNNQIAEGWIFVTKNGKLKDRSNIWREMKRLKEKAGVAESKIFPHNFRHLFARIYYKVTKDITGLADLLGHSSINVTRIYTATTETVFQKKLDKIVEQELCNVNNIISVVLFTLHSSSLVLGYQCPN